MTEHANRVCWDVVLSIDWLSDFHSEIQLRVFIQVVSAPSALQDGHVHEF